jgi:Acetyltransferase (GNAT) family
MIDYIELTHSTEDRKLLRRFYDELYVPEFPDADERESLENMENYLELKAQGWYGKNNYHIIIATESGKLLAGAITDFFAEANAGVIEFLVVSPMFRQSGMGKAILAATENLLINDAKQKLDRDLDCIVCEMNDPFKPTDIKDNLDPVKRSLIWHKWGYGGLDFPYIQPALSTDQESVLNLMLIAKIFQQEWSTAIPSQIVKVIVHEYLRWAMRIETPENCAEYRYMVAFLNGREKVKVLSLDRYVGYDADKPMNIREITSTSDPDFAAVMSVYQHAFLPGFLTIDSQDFAQALTLTQQPNCTYHLWAIRTTTEAKIEGMTSFFSFPNAGFGGYIAFEGSLQGSWRTRSLLARTEQQMLQDRHPNNAEGWYIETDLTKQRSPFLRMGFYEVNIEYEQPPLTEMQASSQIRLFYKPFGRVYEIPKVKCDDFLESIAQIFQSVYGIDTPQTHPSYQKLATQVALFPDGLISLG